MPECELSRAIGADLSKAIQVAVLDHGAVVASAEGAVTDDAAIAPSLGGCDVPDIFVLALQAERILRAKLLSHAGSLPAPLKVALERTYPDGTAGQECGRLKKADSVGANRRNEPRTLGPPSQRISWIDRVVRPVPSGPTGARGRPRDGVKPNSTLGRSHGTVGHRARRAGSRSY